MKTNIKKGVDVYPCRVFIVTVDDRPVFSIWINDRGLFDKICGIFKNHIVTSRDWIDKEFHNIVKILSDVDAHLLFSEFKEMNET